LQAQVQTLSARVAAMDRMLAHSRAQLLEREDALKAAERAIKETGLERSKIERQLATAQEEMNRLLAQLDESSTSRAELSQRCDILVRTVAAKDAALDNANGKVASLSDRLDQLTKRFEQERAALETQSRRLVDELQYEKAERSLAQGALEIARESRLRLQKQHAALKQKLRLGEDEVHQPPAPDGGENQSAEENIPSRLGSIPPQDASDAQGETAVSGSRTPPSHGV
jgi:crescentin